MRIYIIYTRITYLKSDDRSKYIQYRASDIVEAVNVLLSTGNFYRWN